MIPTEINVSASVKILKNKISGSLATVSADFVKVIYMTLYLLTRLVISLLVVYENGYSYFLKLAGWLLRILKSFHI